MTIRYHFKDTLLLDANNSGERLIALIRLAIYSCIGIIPFGLYFIFDDSRPEVMISLFISVTVVIIAALSYWFISAQTKTTYIGWILTGLDISVVTLVLLLIALYSNPIVATNSLVIWQVYGLVIFTTTLRLNLNITVFAGLLSVIQYTILALFLEGRFELVEQSVRSEEYGIFSWPLQLGRIAILILMTLVATGFVSRTRKLVIFSGTDSLTGLKNRAYFEHVFPTEVANSVKKTNPLSIAFLDFDHFKKINDLHGHAVGDSALQAVGDILEKHSPKPFQVARWGGEEFALIYPGQTKEEATALVNKIRTELGEGVRVAPKLSLKLKLSAGVAECPMEEKDPIKLINLADDRMLQAKNAGRDQVVYS
ncbi:MAG: GGDEF domain-containing protein [Gammaproteobacteria bacterium]|nr:GGDEF domain-containing protein [Gammaproteobacteria bacterium]